MFRYIRSCKSNGCYNLVFYYIEIFWFARVSVFTIHQLERYIRCSFYNMIIFANYVYLQKIVIQSSHTKIITYPTISSSFIPLHPPHNELFSSEELRDCNQKLFFVSSTKIHENTIRILNCYFSGQVDTLVYLTTCSKINSLPIKGIYLVFFILEIERRLMLTEVNFKLF